MNQQTTGKGVLQFTLFGIPVLIQPFSWVILGILGLSIYSDMPSPLQPALIFVVVGMVTLLAHEMGHALVSRAVTRSTPYIVISNFGGFTIPALPAKTRLQHFCVVLAGPLAGYLPGVIAAIILGIQVGNVPLAVQLFVLHPFVLQQELGNLLLSGYLSSFSALLYSTFFLVSFWWTVFNLMPIRPMDGGELLLTATNKLRLTSAIGIVLSILLGIWFLTGGSIFMPLMLGYFAWMNWQILKDSRR
ncbi:MAG: hypothetical protein E7033_05285 [Akkermansiaceae bacterium]|nr:hypothetical protein [Akkermansiaceae bacterium]